MYITVTLIGTSKLDSSKAQPVNLDMPRAVGVWDTAWLSINHAVPTPFQLFIGSVYVKIDDRSSPALKRMLKEGNKIEVRVRVRVAHDAVSGSFSLDIDEQKVVGVVKPNTHQWRAYSYKQPTKRLLKRLKSDFIKGYELKIHTVKD